MDFISQREIEDKTKQLSLSKIVAIVKVKVDKISKTALQTPIKFEGKTYYQKQHVEKAINDVIQSMSRLLAKNIQASFKNVGTTTLGNRDGRQFYPLDKLKESINLQIDQLLK